MKSLRVGRHPLQIGLPRPFEEGCAFTLEAVRLTATLAQPLARNLQWDVEEHREIRTLALLHPAFQDTDCLAAQRSTAALVGVRSVRIPVAQHPLSALESRANARPPMFVASSKHQQGFR